MDDQSLTESFDADNFIETWGGHASTHQSNVHHIERRRDSSRPTRCRVLEFPTGNRRRDEFLAVFSHELRGSLGVIRNAVYVLGRQPAESLSSEKARLLIERQVSRMTRLADDLIDMARIKRGGQPLRCERIDLCVVVKHSLETVESEIAARHHRLSTSMPNAPVWLHADGGRLEQVLVNLLVNAAKYTDPQGDLSLSLQHEGDEAIVRIRDSGIGIAPDVLPRVFDLFMQVDASSRHAAAGLGIGLALVRSLVALHGGSVSAMSAGLGKGSEFVVRLPAL
jgi:signal transduction histidine kinase